MFFFPDETLKLNDDFENYFVKDKEFGLINNL